MKKMLIAIIILLLIIIFLLLYCNCRKKCNDCGGKKNSTTSCPYNECQLKFCRPPDPNDLEGLISPEAIFTMSTEYTSDEGKKYITSSCRGTKARPDKDATSVVFDIAKLKNLIYQMEMAVCKNKCDTTVELGIRYYYIKYPCDLGPERHKGDGLDGLKVEERNKHSLVMVPVYKSKKDGEWYDYNLFAAGLYGTDFRGCFPLIGWGGHQDDVGVFWGILPDAGDNHGGIGPPPGHGIFPTNEPE